MTVGRSSRREKGLLPLGRDIARIAIVGPHADDVEAGFSTYMYSTALKMMHARATGGDIAMAGVDLGGTPPPEAKAAIAAEMGPVVKTDRRPQRAAETLTISGSAAFKLQHGRDGQISAERQ